MRFAHFFVDRPIFAIVVSLLLIVAYVTVRFQWQYALPVIIALAHDVVITIGIYALTGFEVTPATVIRPWPLVNHKKHPSDRLRIASTRQRPAAASRGRATSRICEASIGAFGALVIFCSFVICEHFGRATAASKAKRWQKRP